METNPERNRPTNGKMDPNEGQQNASQADTGRNETDPMGRNQSPAQQTPPPVHQSDPCQLCNNYSKQQCNSNQANKKFSQNDLSCNRFG